jgi:hypothetical protein
MYQYGRTCLKGPFGRRRALLVPTEGEAGPKPSQERDAPLRWELVERVRRQIAAGVYDTPDKWEAALERMAAAL